MILPVLIALSGTAMAADPAPRAGFGLGLETTLNDPFTTSPGARLSAEVVLVRWLDLELSGAWYPDLGRANDTSLTRTLRREEGVEPDISYLRSQTRLAAHVIPVRLDVGELHTALGISVGGGVLRSEDAVPPARANDPDLRQWHPLWSIGGVADLYGERLGARLRLEHVDYREDVGGVSQLRRPLFGGIELRVWL